MKSKLIPIILSMIVTFRVSEAQHLTIDADLRMRYEHRHGYSTLFTDTARAANFITQRSRININYVGKHLKLRLSPQNTSVWGDVSTIAGNDPNNRMYEAWIELSLPYTLTLKAGRQALNYDDARILGSVDWIMQGRSHDILLLKINPDSSHTIHTGFAWNSGRESHIRENYPIAGQYTTMQFLWYHGRFDKVALSLLALNQGISYIHNKKETLAWNQTSGFRLTYDGGSLYGDISAYIQTGHIVQNKLLAYAFSGHIGFRRPGGLISGVGLEYLSGKAANHTDSRMTSFTPWFGTNHNFNGFMDYFYVGNHLYSTGLTDAYAYFGYERRKLKLKFTPHCFSTASALYSHNRKANSFLGAELDMTASYRLSPDIMLFGGYSQMLATATMEVLKGGSSKAFNNWIFFSVHCNPEILSHKIKP